MDALLNEILEDLTTELNLTEKSDIAILSSKIKNAIREVRSKRNYPEHFTESQIEKDLERHYSNIRELALYDYNQYGVEGQTSHNENGTNRTWKSRNECLAGVFAYCN
jgi:hypothetical protein